MGMYGQVIPVSESTIRRIPADPLPALPMMGNEEELARKRQKAVEGPGMPGRLPGKKGPPSPPSSEPLMLAEREGAIEGRRRG